MTDTSTIMLGRGKVRIAEYSSYKTNTALVLSESDEIGQTERCAISNDFSFVDNIGAVSFPVLEKILTRNDLYLKTMIMNSSQDNLNMLFGGNRTSGDFFIDSEGFLTFFRLETVFMYPDKVNHLSVIIPKAQVVSTKGMDLVSLLEPSKPEVTFQAGAIGNSEWGTKLGKVLFS